MERSLKMKKKVRAKVIAISVLFMLLLAIVGYGGFRYVTGTSPVSKTEEVILFQVKQGESVAIVLDNLKSEGIIKDPLVVKVYAKLNNLEGVKVGRYYLDKSWDVKKILQTLNDPTASIEVEVTVTLREGLWAKDMAAKIAAVTTVTEEELLALWNDEDFLKEMIEKYEFLTDDILNDQLTVKLEGYLFPETYNFYIDTTARAVTIRLLDQTDKIYQKHKANFNASDLSIHEIFTLASITQFESGVLADDRIISGVWFNRLEIGMALQSSVTVCYALYEYDDWKECERNSGIDSPYNTYKYPGIPIGPVSNPGENAIISVLDPEDTDYLYFLADVYGDGAIYYAETYAEHNANVQKYLNK